MNYVLLLIATLLPLWYAYRRSVSGGWAEINHVTIFSFGFLFYWITPLAVRLLVSKLDFPLASLWSALFRARMIAPYALSCIGLYLCFMLGDSIGTRIFHPGENHPDNNKTPALALSLVTLFGCLFLLYSAYVVRADLFREVAPGANKVGVARGAVTECIVLLSVVAIIFTIDNPKKPWRQRLLSRYFLPLIAGSALMMLLGSRLYVASFLVMFVIYRSNFESPIKLKTVVVVTLIFAFFFGAIGTWREGSRIQGAFFNVFLEPMEGSLSLVHHLRYKGIAWINAPYELATDFENLIPTVLLPNKIKILKQPDAFHPLGGLHSFVSFNLNFGLIGTAAFWLLLPIGLRYLKSRSTHTLAATIYITCSGWLMFTFFRDPFSISLVKAIVENSILIPIAIIGFGQLLSAACAPSLESSDFAAPPRPENA